MSDIYIYIYVYIYILYVRYSFMLYIYYIYVLNMYYIYISHLHTLHMSFGLCVCRCFFENVEFVQVVDLAESFPTRYSNVIFVLQVSRYCHFRFVKSPPKGLDKGPWEGPNKGPRAGGPREGPNQRPREVLNMGPRAKP